MENLADSNVSALYLPRSIESPYEYYVSESGNSGRYTIPGKYHVKLTRTRLVRHVSAKTAFALNNGELTDVQTVPELPCTMSMNGAFVYMGEGSSESVPYLHDHSHSDYQHVLLEIRSDSAIEDISLKFVFPDDKKSPTSCKRGEYPLGFSELYNSKWGVLPPLRDDNVSVRNTSSVDASPTGLWQYPSLAQCNDRVTCIVEIGDGISKTSTYAKSTGDSVVRICDEMSVHDTYGMNSARDDVYQSIVQVPLGDWGVDMRVVTDGVVLIHRYWFRDWILDAEDIEKEVSKTSAALENSSQG